MKFKEIMKKIVFIFSWRSIWRHYNALRLARKILNLSNYKQICNELGVPVKDGEDIWNHYKNKGYPKGIEPCFLFKSDWYKKKYLNEKSNEIPFYHYLNFGDRKNNDFCIYLKNKEFKKEKFDTTRRSQNSLIYLLERKIFSLADLYTFYGDKSFFFRRILEDLILKKGDVYAQENNSTFKYLDNILSEKEKDNLYKSGSLIANQPYVTIFKNVKIRAGTSDIIFDDKFIINDEIYNGLKLKEIYGDPLKNRQNIDIDDNFAARVSYNYIEEKIIKEGVHLLKEYDGNYFHFILEIGTKLDFIDRNGLLDKDIPIILPDYLHENMYSFIDSINLNKRKIIKVKKDVLYNVENLHYISDMVCISDSVQRVPSKDGVIVPKLLIRNLRETVLRNVQPSENANFEKIFVYSDRKYRRVLNIDRIKNLLSEYGFTIITPEEYSFSEQVEIFANAQHVIAPTGALLTNLIWCNRGTKVTVFFPEHEYTNYLFWNLSIGDALDLNIDYIAGKIFHPKPAPWEIHSDYEISITDLIKVLSMCPSANRGSKITRGGGDERSVSIPDL